MNFRLIKKNKSLRIVNLLGLSIVFTSIILSHAYIKFESGYDRFHSNADDIVRLSFQFDDAPVDVRIYGFRQDDDLIAGIPEIKDLLLMHKVNTAMLKFEDKSQVINDFYLVSSNFFDFFSFPLLEGEKSSVLNASEKVAISRKLAKQLYGNESVAIGKKISISGRKLKQEDLFINAVFEDIPENSHFHTDLLLELSKTADLYVYAYLLLDKDTDIQELKNKISSNIDKLFPENAQKPIPLLMPLTDIHLHSQYQREHETNANISYIYLIIGANTLLLIIVLFNLWLNSGLIFANNKRYYQLLGLNGASSSTVLKEELTLSMILAFVSIILGVFFTVFFKNNANAYFSVVYCWEILALSILFLFLLVFVSLLPVFRNLINTLFLNSENDLAQSRNSFSGVKYMLMAQYGIVMFIIILAFGIGGQMNMTRQNQVGGNDPAVLVMKEQPDIVKEKYEILKAELLKYSEIQAVTACMQLPGDAIRDAMNVKLEGEDESKTLSLMLVGNDFLPFFDIQVLSGEIFRPTSISFHEEEQLFFNYLSDNQTTKSSFTEEYIINKKAAEFLGFASPEEAVGKQMHITHGALGYFNQGHICAVVDNFIYTNMYESAFPMIILQRNMFLHCIMLRFDAEKSEQALAAFNRVWSEVIPDYPPDYAFMPDVFSGVYRNELNAEYLVKLFSVLSLIIANLGLIIFMAFIIKRKRKEIGIRKINGATAGEIVLMLNLKFIPWIMLSFLIAVPFAYFVLNKWLENFAYQITLHWWIFALAGLFVFLIALLSVSWQSWRAAIKNPIDAVKSEY